ncbi:uncharacterized protein LOC124300842 [Neodiprion virginianus]|uniref:Uncharacterized protein LOC107223576 isoform X3 n=1 Tax=Neodiprion lecontei TaxID=441921 RepID=A0ABM3FMT5_NEOLC|nr:uncharacterized protein LOC107223576 isoform X3 [Neodiprion lecontei]XP_046611223.1 uncharacterized protein LOC124300842 [Neodiprion virginianus]
MKLALTSLVIVAVLACFVHDASAQRNWWEINQDGSVALTTSRTSTSAPATVATLPTASGLPANCPCVTTPQYNPVCGDNRITYTNPETLKCAQDCGLAVKLLFHGRCEKLP